MGIQHLPVEPARGLSIVLVRYMSRCDGGGQVWGVGGQQRFFLHL